MPFTPHYPLPAATAARVRLSVSEERYRDRISDWGFNTNPLGDHAGLAYYRFVPLVPKRAHVEPGDRSDFDTYKGSYGTKFVQAVAARFSADSDGKGSAPWHVACRRAAARLRASVNDLAALDRPVRQITRTTSARLLVGMGYKNALEVGLTFHHPGGFPFLPGTSVKGLCRAWAEGVEDLGATPEGRATLQRVFGSATKRVDDEDEFVAGQVVFLDALPERFPPLEADLLNPHVGPYYMDAAGTTAPSDWLSPVPVSFLAVGAGAPFCFALVGRTPEAEADVALAWGWLMEALTHLGAGGKTQAGYGFFAPVLQDGIGMHRSGTATEGTPLPALQVTTPQGSRSRKQDRPGRPPENGGEQRPELSPQEIAEINRRRREEEEQKARLEAAEKLQKKKEEAPDRARSVKKNQVLKALVVRLGNPARVYIAAVGHDQQHLISAQKLPEDTAVGAWILVQVTNYNDRKQRASQVHYVGETETPGRFADPVPPKRTGGDPGPGGGNQRRDPGEPGEVSSRMGPFEGSVKRIKFKGTRLIGQIDSPAHESLVKFDAAQAGADEAGWKGRRVRFYTDGADGVDVELLPES